MWRVEIRRQGYTVRQTDRSHFMQGILGQHMRLILIQHKDVREYKQRRKEGHELIYIFRRLIFDSCVEKNWKRWWGFPGGSAVKNLPACVQERWVQSLVQEDSICYRATNPVHRNYQAMHATACAPQEKPPQREAHTLQGEQPPLAATREKPMQQQRSNTAKSK